MIDRNIWNHSKPMYLDIVRVNNYVMKYFLFRNIELQKENAKVILQSLTDFAEEKRYVKTYDFYLSLKKYSDSEERNLSASYFQSRLIKYLASDEYKSFMGMHLPQLEEQKKEINVREEALKNIAVIEEGYKKHGGISVAMSDNMFAELEKHGIFDFIKESHEEIEFQALTEEKMRNLKLSESQLDIMIAKEYIRNFDDIDLGVFKLNSKEKIIRRYKMKLYLQNKYNDNS